MVLKPHIWDDLTNTDESDRQRDTIADDNPTMLLGEIPCITKLKPQKTMLIDPVDISIAEGSVRVIMLGFDL